MRTRWRWVWSWSWSMSRPAAAASASSLGRTAVGERVGQTGGDAVGIDDGDRKIAGAERRRDSRGQREVVPDCHLGRGYGTESHHRAVLESIPGNRDQPAA